MKPPTSLAMTVAVCGAVCVLASKAEACDFGGDSSWHWSDSRLVAGTREIFLGRLIDSRANEKRPQWRDYLFEVVESIKGADKAPTRWLGPFMPWDSPMGGPQGRAIYDVSCSLLVSFRRDELYLVFRDSFHPRGYELVTADDDQWLKTVRSLAKVKPSAAAIPGAATAAR